MRRWAFLTLFCIALGLFIFDIDDTVIAQETVSSYMLADLQYEVYPTFSRILFASNEKIDYVTYELEDPYRIVIDLIGVVFCELEEHAEYDEGQIRSVDIMKTPYAQHPKGLDEFYYAVDYIMITPAARLPYTVSSSEDSRVLAIDIGDKSVPQLRVSMVSLLTEADIAAEPSEYIEEPEKEAVVEKPPKALEGSLPPGKEIPYMSEHYIIDNIQWEPMDEASLLVISANNDIGFLLTQKYKPELNIILKPKHAVFTDLEEELEINGRYIKSLRIVKDKTIKTPSDLDRYFYPVRYIILELTQKRPFDFYSSEDGTISIFEVYSPKSKKAIEAVRAGMDLPRPAARDREFVTRRELLKELKKDIKREGLLKEDKIEWLKEEEIERRKLDATQMAEYIGKEVLKDLFVRGKGILSLSEAQSTAIKNSPQAATTKEEIKLAKLKKREAFRALFPQVKLKATHTTGDVLGVDFIEEVYGVQGEQAVYQGGKLWNTYQQSKVNLKLANVRYGKIENDLDLKVAEAYYGVVTAIMNIKLQEELLQKAERVLSLAEKRHDAGLSTDLEILNAKSQHNQIQFQLATAGRDLALARFKLQQAMSLDLSEGTADLSDIDTELEFKVIDINLAKCLELASENQPDILVNNLLVESNEYGEKIAKAKDRFKVDVTGFYGKADSYYETEEKNLEKDWNIGVKVSKPLWGQGVNYSFTKDETSRKVGQTDRTGSESHAGEISLFDKDAMTAASEIKEAYVNRRNAQNNLIETRRQTALEVKEGYYNYQESILQVKNSLEKVRFQEEALKVASAQAGLNEALQSQMIEAMIKLSDEKALYIKALSDYNLSLVKLNKAIGIKDYFRID